MSSKKQAHGNVRALRMCDVYNLSLGYSLRPVLLLDIRSGEEYNASHCFGAASVPINAHALDAALEAGMSSQESASQELFSLLNAQLLRPPEHLGGMFDGVFNRKLVHHERFIDREHSIVCVYGSVVSLPSSASASHSAVPAQISITQRVANAIAAQSSTEFTCFYMTEAFDMFRQEYPHAVQKDSWRQSPSDTPPPPSPPAAAAAAAAAASGDDVSREDDVSRKDVVSHEDDGAGVFSAAQHPAASEFDLKGCPPM